MQILRNLKELKDFLGGEPIQRGCLADTGFLYALAYDDDRLFNTANDVFDLIGSLNTPLYANVISRLEFVDLIFRKQITDGAIQIFETMKLNTVHKDLWSFLRNIRDQNTAHKKLNMSYKVDEGRLKRLRYQLEEAASPIKWREFCKLYSGTKLFNEWRMIEEDLGLNFIEILEGHASEHFHTPLLWSDMVNVMGEQGLRGPDAMIVNLFSKSKFPLLITSDTDFENCFTNQLDLHSDKAIYILQ